MRSCALRLTNTTSAHADQGCAADLRRVWCAPCSRAGVRGLGREQLRDFTYVEDAVDAFLLAALTPRWRQACNIGGHGPVSLQALAETLCGE